MKDWASAGDKIRRRSFPHLIESLKIETPFAFDPENSFSEVPDFIETNWDSIKDSSDTIISLPGRDVNFTRDCLISIYKFFHVLECARSQFERGALTWMMVDAYHASLLGARSLCALFGVLSYSVKGRTILIDFRPEFGSVDDMKRFRKEYHRADNPIRVLQPAARLLEQKDVWTILKRICNVCERLDGMTDALDKLSATAAKPLSQIRNQVLYDSVFWQWRADFSSTTKSRSVLAQSVASTGEKVEMVDLCVCSITEIFETTRFLTDKFCGAIGVVPGSLGPLASLKASPNAIVA